MPCHGQEQQRQLSYLQFMKMAAREEFPYFNEEFLLQVVGCSLPARQRANVC